MEFKEFDYFGFKGYNFEFNGLVAKIVMPKVKPDTNADEILALLKD